MRIIRYHAYGPSSVLQPEEVDVPAYGPHEVLVRTEAIGVDHADVQRRSGRFPLGAPTLPYCPSADVSGTVVEVGDRVTGLTPGTRVTVWKAPQAYAEYVAAPADRVLPLPAGLDPAEATLVGAPGRVALNLLRTARMAPGETVLVHSGAGAVGHIAVQAARALGAGRVIATAGSARKLDFIRSTLGADEAIDYTDPHWPDRIKGGVDVILDGIGGPQLLTDVALLAPYGRLMVFGGSGGDAQQPSIPVLDLLSMRQVIGFSMATLMTSRPDLAAAALKDLLTLVSTTQIRPTIHARIPLSKAAEAHALLESRHPIGRVVLTP
ncbi:zinc-binding alcohol dehydrogenase family protein [Streptomyces sp. NPDC059957]|uniref:quinone oxidoreductase family protein n=1 Tax=unclassified Streptomyces TaxID=2593676 RepID=UPI003660D129